MNVIYAHIRGETDNIRSWNTNPYISGKIPWHCHQALDIFCRLGYDVYFITANENTDLNEVQAPVKEKFRVKNECFDFGIFKKGLIRLKELKKLNDDLILMNDSFFFIPENVDRLQKVIGVSDFWGMTYYIRDGGIPPHIQTFIIGFSAKVVKSQTFKDYWESVSYDWNKADVIHRGEVALTGILWNAGFKFVYFADFTEHQKGWGQPGVFRAKSPVLKIKNNELIYESYRNRYKQG